MRRRVLQTILLVVVATALALGVPLGIVSWQLVGDHTRNGVQNRLESVTSSVEEQLVENGTVDVRRLAIAIPAGGQLRIQLPGVPDQVMGTGTTAERYQLSMPVGDGGVVTLSVPAQGLNDDRRTAVLLVISAVGASVLLGTAIALVLARRLSRPATQLAERAARLGAGDFRTFPDRFGIAEYDRVADVLDASAVDISALLGRERDLTGDISHQLRTRLTGMRLQLEELSGHGEPEVAAVAGAALDQTDQLVGVVDELLAAARKQQAASARRLSLAAELAAIAAQWQPRLRAAGRTLSLDCPAGVMVKATPLRLRETLGVLLDNALRHGAGAVTIGVRPGAGMTVVEVTDEGPGIPDTLAGHVFDRGISTASSTGIGLDLARAFVEADGGRLELRRPAPPVFAVFLPTVRPE